MARRKGKWWGDRLRQRIVKSHTQFQGLKEEYEEKGDAERAAICREGAAHLMGAMRCYDRLDLRPPRVRSMYDTLGIEPPPPPELDEPEEPDEPESG